MLTQEQFVCQPRVVQLSGTMSEFNMALLKLAGIVVVGMVGIAAPFIIHAAITKKPGTVWEA